MNKVLQYKPPAENGIALEQARLCTVCWTIHLGEDCPACGARQWHKLMDVLTSLASGAEPDAAKPGRKERPRLQLVCGEG